MANVSSSLATLPAFETEHTLFVAEEVLRRRQQPQPPAAPSCALSVALQAVADAYATRRAGDRGDNLERAAALLSQAASLPAARRCEAAARAHALARLARARLARANVPDRGAVLITPSPAPIPDVTAPIDTPEIDAPTPVPEPPTLAPLPAFMAPTREPIPSVKRLAHMALLAAIEAAKALSASSARSDAQPELPTGKPAADAKAAEGSSAADGKTQVDEKADAMEVVDKDSPEGRRARNLHAAVCVDRARALLMGAPATDSESDSDENISARVEGAIVALTEASQLCEPQTRRERAASALCDILLASLHARERGKSDMPAEPDRVRAGQLLRSAGAVLTGIFGGGGSEDSDSTVSESPPTSPAPPQEDFAHGSDCSEESLGASGSPAKDGAVAADGHYCPPAREVDAFDPFEEWDMDEVKRFVDDEMRRLGPVTAEGETRRSCVIC